jgi:hypothetical protein
MDGGIWIDNYKNNPLTKKFLKQFGGQFVINAEDGSSLFYIDDSSKNDYDIPHSGDDKKDEKEYIRLITQSIEQNKNLLILREPY